MSFDNDNFNIIYIDVQIRYVKNHKFANTKESLNNSRLWIRNVTFHFSMKLKTNENDMWRWKCGGFRHLSIIMTKTILS